MTKTKSTHVTLPPPLLNDMLYAVLVYRARLTLYADMSHLGPVDQENCDKQVTQFQYSNLNISACIHAEYSVEKTALLQVGFEPSFYTG